jgi:alanine racemase
MDKIIVEGNLRDKLHDKVIIFGNPEKGDKQTVFDVTNMSNTITYEVLVRINSRVNIKYINL